MQKLCNFIVLVLIVLAVARIQSYPTYYYDKDSYDSREAPPPPQEPAEVQHAMCNIVTDQIRATANATITRQLKGVCHANEVRAQLKHIELALTRELHKIHRVVLAVANEQKLSKKPPPVVYRFLPRKY